MRLPPIQKLVENECLRVASIFGTDELNKRELIVDIQYKDLFGDEYECLGRKIPVDYLDLSHLSKPVRMVERGYQ